MKKVIIAVILAGSAFCAGCGGAGDETGMNAGGPAASAVPSGNAAELTNASADEAAAVYASEKISAESAASDGANSASVGDEQEAALPAVPSGLAVEDCGSSLLTIRWKDASGAQGYNVYRALSLSGTYTKLNAEPSVGTLFTDEGLSESTLYCYKVSAVNAAGESALSSAVSQRTANSSMAYVRFCNLGSVSIAGMRLGRSWFRPVKVGETTSYVEALPGTYFFEYWNAETLEWETISTGMFTLQAGRRYTLRDTDAAAYLETDDVLKREDAAVFIENMSSSKNQVSPAHVSK